MLVDTIPKLAQLEGEEHQHEYAKRASLADPSRCIRQLDYMAQKYPKQSMPGRTYIVFDLGNWIEEIIADKLRRSAYKLHSEQMSFVVDGISCHIDGIITDLLGVDRLWEQKGLNTFTAQRYWNGELPIGYFTQMSLYIRGLQKYGIKEGILLILDKNSSQLSEYIIRYNIELDTCTVVSSQKSNGEFKEINQEFCMITTNAINRFAEVEKYTIEKKLHDRQYMLGEDWQCSYCVYSDLCWSTYEQEFSEMKTEVELPSDIADAIRYYLELNGQSNDIGKEAEKLKIKIKAVMKEQKAQTGRAGEYLVKLKLSEVERIDKTLLSAAELERCSKKSFSERLYISNMNKKEKK